MTENDKSRFGPAAMPRALILAEHALAQPQRLYPCRRSNLTSSQLLFNRAEPMSIGKGEYNPTRLESKHAVSARLLDPLASLERQIWQLA